LYEQRAFLARLRLFHDTGRLAAAEQLVLDSVKNPRYDRTQLMVMLVPIYSQIGRSDEAERLIEERFQHLTETDEVTQEQAIKLLQPHIDLTVKASTAELLRLYLDQMGKLAQDDDRVWLGRANLAIQTGKYDDAKRWLDACQRRRANDVPVWRAWRDWGFATNRIEVVKQAIEHLPAADSSPTDAYQLNAWLCRQRGDAAGEHQELERLLAANPSDLKALDRLSKLATDSGNAAEVAELARKRAEIDQLWARYRKLYERGQPVRDAEEMAHLAKALGRTFEARVFLTLAILEEPERAELSRELAAISQSQVR
jgi:tetratricopeptide (TPR) repeat protein